MNKELYDQLIKAGEVLVYREDTEKAIRIYSDKIEEQNYTLEKALNDIKKKPKFFVLRLVLGILATYFGGSLTIGIISMSLMMLAGILLGILPAGIGIAGEAIALIITAIIDGGWIAIIQMIFVGLIGLPIALVSLVVFLGILGIFFGIFGILSIGILVTGIVLLTSIPKSKKKHIKNATAKYENLKADFEEKNKILEDEINRLSEELSNYLDEHGTLVEFLPLDYQTVHAVGFMLKVVRNLRADTLKEAINLYDQELKHLEAMAAAERQKQQNEEIIYAMKLLNMNMESMSENQARANQILKNINDLQEINVIHHW